MTKSEINKLIELLNPPDIKDKIASRVRALAWVESQTPTVEPKKPRSNAQNSSLHLWLTWIAHEANNIGLTLQDIIKVVHKIEIRPSAENLKEILVKPYIESAYQLKSTTKINNQQLNETYDAMNKLFSHYWHISVPFPNDEQRQLEESSGYKTNAGIGAKGVEYPNDYQGAPTI